MLIDLISERMLGHWDVSHSVSQCEFQFGGRLVYVQHPKNESPQPYIFKAQQMVTAAWNDIENAVHFAEQRSRHLEPEFWKVHDESQKPGLRFNVYSIHFDITDPYPTYVVGKNHDFDFQFITYAEEDLWRECPITTELPEPYDNCWLIIRRLGHNHFESLK